MRAKENKILIEGDVARRVTEILNNSPKSQREIANEIGYTKNNIITMFKQGTTKVPLTKAAALARACDVDELDFVRLCLAEYAPQTLEAIESTMGRLLSPHERLLVERLRHVQEEQDRGLQLTEDGLNRFGEFAGRYLLEPRVRP